MCSEKHFGGSETHAARLPDLEIERAVHAVLFGTEDAGKVLSHGCAGPKALLGSL